MFNQYHYCPFPLISHITAVPGIYFHGSWSPYETQGWLSNAFQHSYYHTNDHHQYCRPHDYPSSNPNPYGLQYISAVGTSLNSKHKRRATDGKKKAWRKKYKYQFGRRSTTTKLSSNKTTKRIRVGGSKSLEVDHAIETVDADKMFDNGPEKDLKTSRYDSSSAGHSGCGINQVFVKSSERPSTFESKILEFAQSLKRVEEMLKQMIPSAKKHDNQDEDAKIETDGANDVAREKEKISKNDAHQAFDNCLWTKSPQRDGMESMDEHLLAENHTGESVYFSSLGEWGRIYKQICEDYESQSVHINGGGGEVLGYEDKENSDNKEHQVFDKSPQKIEETQSVKLYSTHKMEQKNDAKMKSTGFDNEFRVDEVTKVDWDGSRFKYSLYQVPSSDFAPVEHVQSNLIGDSMKNLAANDDGICDTEYCFKFKQLLVERVKELKHLAINLTTVDEFVVGEEPDHYWKCPNSFCYEKFNLSVSSNKKMCNMRGDDEWQGELDGIYHYLRDFRRCTCLSGELTNAVLLAGLLDTGQGLNVFEFSPLLDTTICNFLSHKYLLSLNSTEEMFHVLWEAEFVTFESFHQGLTDSANKTLEDYVKDLEKFITDIFWNISPMEPELLLDTKGWVTTFLLSLDQLLRSNSSAKILLLTYEALVVVCFVCKVFIKINESRKSAELEECDIMGFSEPLDISFSQNMESTGHYFEDALGFLLICADIFLSHVVICELELGTTGLSLGISLTRSWLRYCPVSMLVSLSSSSIFGCHLPCRVSGFLNSMVNRIEAISSKLAYSENEALTTGGCSYLCGISSIHALLVLVIMNNLSLTMELLYAKVDSLPECQFDPGYANDYSELSFGGFFTCVFLNIGAYARGDFHLVRSLTRVRKMWKGSVIKACSLKDDIGIFTSLAYGFVRRINETKLAFDPGDNNFAASACELNIEFVIFLIVAYYLGQVRSYGSKKHWSPLFFLLSSEWKPLLPFQKHSSQNGVFSVRMEDNYYQRKNEVGQFVYKLHFGLNRTATKGLSLALPHNACFGMLGPDRACKNNFPGMMNGPWCSNIEAQYIVGREQPLFHGILKFIKGSALSQEVKEFLKSFTLPIFVDLAIAHREIFDTGTRNKTILALVIFSLYYDFVKNEFWKYKLKDFHWDMKLKVSQVPNHSLVPQVGF